MTDKREYGAPRTSNRASAESFSTSARFTFSAKQTHVPAGSVAAEIELLSASALSMGESVVGVALIWIARRLWVVPLGGHHCRKIRAALCRPRMAVD